VAAQLLPPPPFLQTLMSGPSVRLTRRVQVSLSFHLFQNGSICPRHFVHGPLRSGLDQARCCHSASSRGHLIVFLLHSPFPLCIDVPRIKMRVLTIWTVGRSASSLSRPTGRFFCEADLAAAFSTDTTRVGNPTFLLHVIFVSSFPRTASKQIFLQ